MRKIALVLIACMFAPLPAAQAADDQALNINVITLAAMRWTHRTMRLRGLDTNARSD